MQNESWQRAIAERRSWTEEEAARAVALCDTSGMTTAAFARRHGSAASRFQYWRKRLRDTGTASAGLLPVRVVEAGQARLVERAPGRVVLLDGQLRVEMEGMTAEWVATLLRLVRESAQ
jgi:transposase-like protein